MREAGEFHGGGMREAGGDDGNAEGRCKEREKQRGRSNERNGVNWRAESSSSILISLISVSHVSSKVCHDGGGMREAVGDDGGGMREAGGDDGGGMREAVGDDGGGMREAGG
ncbi:hypothetical protein ACLOJK_028321 [Asimina triloba]